MQYLDLSFPAPHHNLACDEALLNRCEDGLEGELLRFWETNQYFVVAGYSNKIALEVNQNSCASYNIPILRRPSGGGTVLQGPGCLNYSLLLDTRARKGLETLLKATALIMETHRKALEVLLKEGVDIRGISDLTFRGLKFSGNAQRRKKNFLLFHGTFLIGMDLAMIEKTLRMPSKQPAYRKARPHQDFLINIPAAAPEIKEALKRAWKAESVLAEIPYKEINDLAAERYLSPAWNEKF